MPNLEHEIQENNPGIYLSLSIARYVHHVRQISSEFDLGRHLFWPDCTLGQSSTEENSHTAHSSVRYRAHCK